MRVEETNGSLVVRTVRPVVSIVLGVAALATGAAMLLTIVGPGMSTRGIVAASAAVVALLGAEIPLTKSFGSRIDEIVEAADRINRFQVSRGVSVSRSG